MLSTYPQIDAEFINPKIEEELTWLKAVIQTVRTIRSEMTISPAKLIPLYLRNFSAELRERIEKYHNTLIALGKLTHIRYMEEDEPVPISASAVIGELELLIPMAGLIDKTAELARLEKELGKLNKDIALAEGKLNNPQFADNAPAEIIAKEREKLEQAQISKEKLLHHQKTVETLP